MPPLTLRLLTDDLVICRLPAGAAVETSPTESSLWSLTRTAGETSLVCAAADAPAGSTVEAGWAALAVDGPLDFGLTGVIAELTVPLADAGISVFVISTYDTDLVLVRSRDLDRAVSVLRSAGVVVAAT